MQYVKRSISKSEVNTGQNNVLAAIELISFYEQTQAKSVVAEGKGSKLLA